MEVVQVKVKVVKVVKVVKKVKVVQVLKEVKVMKGDGSSGARDNECWVLVKVVVMD